jgi:hypothetical protein
MILFTPQNHIQIQLHYDTITICFCFHIYACFLFCHIEFTHYLLLILCVFFCLLICCFFAFCIYKEKTNKSVVHRKVTNDVDEQRGIDAMFFRFIISFIYRTALICLIFFHAESNWSNVSITSVGMFSYKMTKTPEAQFPLHGQ